MPGRGPIVPALGFRFLTPIYDSVMAATMREARFKSALVAQAALAHGQRVLDLGCGTGTLTILLRRSCPGAFVMGLDADPEALALARQKVRDSGLRIPLLLGRADAPPFGPASLIVGHRR